MNQLRWPKFVHSVGDPNYKPKLTRTAAATILLLTVLYLCMELPFAANLLDSVGSPTTPDKLQLTEVAGRLISGFAAALFAWGVFIIPRCLRSTVPLGRTVLLCAVWAVPIMMVVYFGERGIIDHLAATATATQRQNAFAVVLFTGELENGHASVRGLNLDDEELATPQGKSFIALLPFMASTMTDIRTRLAPAIHDLVRNQALRKTGGPAASYDQGYVASVETLKSSYDQYRQGVKEYYDRRDQVPEKAARAYQEYRADLAKNFRGPPPRWYWKRIRKKVRAKGVPVTDNWNCWDSGPFIDAAVRQGNREADNAFASRTAQLAGAPIPSTLGDFDEFVATSAIQRRWHDSLRVPDDVRLDAHYTFASWDAEVYEPIIERQTKTVIDAFEAQSTEYAPGGKFFKQGDQAMRALLVPPIALIFSLIGAFGHFIKSFITFCYLIQPRITIWTRVAVFSLGVFVSAIPLFVPNDLTRTPVYAAIEADMGETAGVAVADSMTWVIQTQALVYPFNSALRSYVIPYFDVENTWVTKGIAHLSQG